MARVFDFLLPEGRAALVALFDQDAVDTALLVRRSGHAIDRVLGPEVLREIVGPLGGDFRRDHRVIRRAVERDLGPLSLALFTETSTLHSLLRRPQGGAWAEAIAMRNVVFDPLPAWMALAAGAGAVRAATSRWTGAAAGLEVLGAMSPTFRKVKQAADALLGMEIETVLGFNPLHVLAQILGRTSSSGSKPSDESVD
jgi:hypothetical protein